MSGNHHRPKTKTLFLLVTYGVLLYVGLQNFSALRGVFAWIFAILQPVAYGICIAFVINLFLKFFRTKVFRGMASSPHPWEQRLCPVMSAICTGLVAFAMISAFIFLIVPQVTAAINMLIEKMPDSQEQLVRFAEKKLNEWNAPDFILQYVHEFDMDWDTIVTFLGKFMEGKITTVLGTAFSATASMLSTASNLLLGLIIAIYLLAQKERVLYVLQKLIELFVPQQYRANTLRILQLTNQSFANFLSGQFIEAVIIGTLCAIGLTIFRFPYSGTIGILVGVTALIPIIGAWIGGGIGALLVWVVAPERVIWFLVFILVLQQLEGQFIYPRVVGNSIGLPGVLVLIAVILGTGFGGILGLIFAVPLFAILYSLLKDAIDRLPQSETAPAEGGTEDAEPPEDDGAASPAEEEAETQPAENVHSEAES